MADVAYRVESFGVTHVGLSRKNNEDVFETVPEKQFFILADGMGGHKAGEVAALEAVQHVCQLVRQMDFEKGHFSVQRSAFYLRRMLESANSHVFQLSRKNAEYTGMGTTLSCFLIHEHSLVYAHVGDSRLYRFRQKSVLDQLTLDHSLKASLLDDEPLLQRNAITRALGTMPHILPDVGVISLLPSDLYFLCSDGLTDLVSDQMMHAILEQNTPVDHAANSLVNTALERGGKDNITVLMAKVLA